MKILLANRPKMLREVLRDLIGRQGDMVVVGEALDPLEVLLAVRRTEADVVVTTLPSSSEPGISSHLLAEYPQLVVVALDPEGHRAILYRQVLVKETLDKVDNQDLFSKLRKVISQASDEDR